MAQCGMSAMYKQINLYQPVFRKQEKIFGTATLLLIIGAVMCLLLAIIAHAHWTLGAMEQTAQSLQQQVTHLSGQLTTLQAQRRTPDTAALERKIAALHTSIEQRNRLLSQFDRLLLQQEKGFASWFEALAGLRMPGLWLEGVSIDNEQRVELRGLALDARLVPRYLQQLEATGKGHDKPFATVSVTRLDSQRPQLQFVLRNFQGTQAW